MRRGRSIETPVMVREMIRKAREEEGLTFAQLAQKFEVSVQTCQCICKRLGPYKDD
jgi:ribosome-binding protein aMBF1 (putative translation factor)